MISDKQNMLFLMVYYNFTYKYSTYTPFLEDFNFDKHAHFAEDFQMLFTNANFLQIINCLFSVQKPLYTVQY